ncbi:MAG: FlgD immunoglobulin-like domain containing protein [bacterium]
MLTALFPTFDIFKIAFIGDQGAGENARAVLELIKEENAQAIMHQGDFDYVRKPASWDSLITAVLGADFPCFGTMGNHDSSRWDGNHGYQQYLENRLMRAGIPWEGDLGVQSCLHYEGIFLVQVAPGLRAADHDIYIREQLATDNSIWSICSWHKNQNLMQVGGMPDAVGWEVYEESRRGGAIIATAHDHSYGRTYLLSDMSSQIVASRSDTLVISKGESFVFVSGLGGRSIHNGRVEGNWWACTHNATQGANYGALFGTFNANGQANLATFYFKDITGRIIDRFTVRSEVEDIVTSAVDKSHALPAQIVLEQNYPNPFNPSTTIRFRLARPEQMKLTVRNARGQLIRTVHDVEMPAGMHELDWNGRDNDGFMVPSGTYFCRLESGSEVATRKLVLVQ